jgi:KUP system potassium uptake protein
MVWISVAILVFLFSVQQYGTDKVGYSFALIISVWFLLITAIGVYNLAVHDATVLKAFNPMYIVYYFRRNGKEAWASLGGAVLCITGVDAEKFLFRFMCEPENGLEVYLQSWSIN